MRKRLGSLLLALALVCSLGSNVLAIDHTRMTDIDGHWGYNNISYCLERNLFAGVSETEFAPEGVMSRAMFVTVLGRLAGVNPEDYRDWTVPYLYRDIRESAYYAPYLNWATRNGIIAGVGERQFAPNADVTREQVAAILMRFISNCNYQLHAVSDNPPAYFTDQDQISNYAAYAVETLRTSGVFGGFKNEDGTYSFGPKGGFTRAQCATVLAKIHQALEPYYDRQYISPTEVALDMHQTELRPGDYTYLYATVYPDDVTVSTVTWFSDNPAVAVVTGGRVDAVGVGEANIYAMAASGVLDACLVTVEPIEPMWMELSAYTLTMNLGGTQTLRATVYPENATDKSVTWASGDESIVKVKGGALTAVGAGQTTVTAISSNGLRQTCTVTVLTDESLAYLGESYTQKCQRIYGDYTDATYFDGVRTLNARYASQLAKDQVNITVRVWDFADRSHTTKVTKNLTFPVHKKIAPTIRAIFEEIYNGEEKFPIYSVWGYRSGETGEHGSGTAIDINPEENYQIYGGTVTAGKYWKPGEDPYSIPVGGDVDNAFSKYGFRWGATFNSSKDYMHWSYLGI